MVKWFDAKRDWELVKTILVALVLALSFRSFAYEPFHIPSGSMKGTLLIGDYLWVSKFSYGYSRYSFPFGAPLFEGRLMAKEPERGDVVVFRPVKRPRVDFIKRVVGLPGDRVQMRDGVLYLNDVMVPREPVGEFVDFNPDGRMEQAQQYRETLPNGVSYLVLDADSDGALDNTDVYVVPPGHYFMMGDNRDRSVDSRVLSEVGFVPFENLIGQAQILFFSTNGTARIWEPWKWFQATRFARFFHVIG